MTVPKLVTNPPEGCGLLPQMVQGHYDDLVRGKPGELIAAECLLQPVGQKSRRTKDGWKTEVVYELVRLEPARDSHEADNIAWNITRAYEARTSGSSQQELPLSNSPEEQRQSLLEALREWSDDQNLEDGDLNGRWLSYFGEEHAASATVKNGSLLQLMEFARYIGAVEDASLGSPDPADEDDGFGKDEPTEDDDQAGSDDETTGLVVPFRSGA